MPAQFSFVNRKYSSLFRSSVFNLTFLAAAFASAFVVGVSLHYHKIVQNEWFGYPQEWFPSVSSTIGDRYPERSFFMLFIAITSGKVSTYSSLKRVFSAP
jgi:hypothetical protein